MIKPKSIKIIFTAPPKFKELIEEVSIEKGLSISEILRTAFSRYYDDIYIPNLYGYQAGSKTSSRRLKNQDSKTELEIQIDNIETMEDDELTKLIYESGYITEEEQIDRNWFVGTDEESGYKGLWYSYKNNPSSKAIAFKMEELRLELKKHFKKMKRNEKSEQQK